MVGRAAESLNGKGLTGGLLITGLLLTFFPQFFSIPVRAAAYLLLLMLVGQSLFVWGCMRVAQARGYRSHVGFWWGMLSIVGLFVLWTMPQKASVAVRGSQAAQSTKNIVSGRHVSADSKEPAEVDFANDGSGEAPIPNKWVVDIRPRHPLVRLVAGMGALFLLVSGVLFVYFGVLLWTSAKGFFVPMMILGVMIGVSGGACIAAACKLAANAGAKKCAKRA